MDSHVKVSGITRKSTMSAYLTNILAGLFVMMA